MIFLPLLIGLATLMPEPTVACHHYGPDRTPAPVATEQVPISERAIPTHYATGLFTGP